MDYTTIYLSFRERIFLMRLARNKSVSLTSKYIQYDFLLSKKLINRKTSLKMSSPTASIATPKTTGYFITNEGREYIRFKRFEPISFFMRSILTPIIVAILTTLLVNWLL